MRLFIAVFPPKDVQRAILRRLSSISLPKKISWAPPENFHITLKFIGNTKNESIFKDVIVSVCSRHQVFSLAMNGGGGFPSLSKPRVLWTGLSGDLERLRRLAGDVEQQCTGLGFPPENRGFSPHVTVARVEGLDSKAQEAYSKVMSDFKTEPFSITDVHLVRSQTLASGSVYTSLFSQPLLV